MNDPQAYHHRDQRPYIPSEAEAGAEQLNPKVQNQPSRLLDKDPVIHRGQDPHLNWLGKYAHDHPDERPDYLRLDIRSLYRHEHVRPEALMQRLYRQRQAAASAQLSLFGPSYQDVDELDKPLSYYQHHADWENRLILGDSLAVMTSLLEREGLNGQVQMMYLDPPYGIKYGSNWQIKLNNRTVQDGKDEHLSSEPEQIKAFRDTWELGIHSYLSYLRDRLLVARELLTESGSCFVQISDENVHLVRNLMDEVFGSENFVSLITYTKTSSQTDTLLASVSDYIIWYAKRIETVKFHQLYSDKTAGAAGAEKYTNVEIDGVRMTANQAIAQFGKLPPKARFFTKDNMTSQRPPGSSTIDFQGKKFVPNPNYWKTSEAGIYQLIAKNRITIEGNNLRYVRYLDDFPVFNLSNVWSDIGGIQSRTDGKVYVVQTSVKAIQRCLLMCTDPGDLVLDPTCGSGTTAYVAEQWGRRWITIDTSRIALNIAKTRLMTAAFPYYKLYDEAGQDVRQGFVYKEVPHITLKSLANDEPPATEKLYDQPEEDKKRLRVAGPFTVETLQSLNPTAPEDLEAPAASAGDLESQQQFESRVFAGLTAAGVRNGAKNEQAVFLRVERRASPALPAEGYWRDASGLERKAYFVLGPRFGTVSKPQVNEAVKECRQLGDADWLVVLGFAFDDSIENREQTFSAGTFQVTRVRIGEDLLQEGLLKKDKKAASFVTIGEPEIAVVPADASEGGTAGAVCLEVRGLDIWDPIHNRLAARSVEDIAYWMLDDDYDGSNFLVRQVFFCGGEKTEFRKWRQKLDNQASLTAKQRAEATLRVELDEDAWARLYGFRSHPLAPQPGRRVAVRVISQFGEESTRVLAL